MSMESLNEKPHAICIPVPAQGHINPMLKLAKLLHFHGFHITFVHTEFNYQRLLKSRGSNALNSYANFRFETMSDGLPPTNPRGILDLPAMWVSIPIHGLKSIRDLIIKLNASPDVPPVTCIVADAAMSFTLKVAEEFGIQEMLLFTASGCGILGYLQFDELIQRGYFPLKDESYLTNGYLDTKIDWIPAMKGIRLKDLPTFIRTTDPNDIMFNYTLESIDNALKSKCPILHNTFDELEQEVLEAIKLKFPSLYTIGPLSLLYSQHCEDNPLPIESNLWEENKECLNWLDKREVGSVVYVNYGSLTIMSPEQLSEFAWGLANSKFSFLWVIRPDLVNGGVELITDEFMEEIRDRSLLVAWVPQEEILRHPSIGGFLTHCGWNSTLESICEGTPMLCWPFFSEQQINCVYLCSKWEIGMEIDTDVGRDKVEGLIRELMEGEKGKLMREKAMEWKKRASEATKVGGPSYMNFDMVVRHLKQEPVSN